MVAIILVFGGLWLVTLAIGDRNSPDIQLGDQRWNAGNAERLAEKIARDEAPILVADVSGRRDRDVILQHVGADPETGWYAFLAAPIDKARDCTWEWQPDEELFRAKCDPSLTAPADGEGLTQFRVTVDGDVVVDLNYDERTAREAEADAEADPVATTTTAVD